MQNSLQSNQGAERKLAISPTNRKYRILLVIMLVILSVQAWFGDFVNIFQVPPTSPVPAQSFAGLIQAIRSLGVALEWHAVEGLGLVIFGVALAILSFVWSKSKGVRISSILALLSLISAAIGGVLFVLSGFSAGGNSMQMGGSFVAAYALYFVALFYAK